MGAPRLANCHQCTSHERALSRFLRPHPTQVEAGGPCSRSRPDHLFEGCDRCATDPPRYAAAAAAAGPPLA